MRFQKICYETQGNNYKTIKEFNYNEYRYLLYLVLSQSLLSTVHIEIPVYPDWKWVTQNSEGQWLMDLTTDMNVKWMSIYSIYKNKVISQ